MVNDNAFINIYQFLTDKKPSCSDIAHFLRKSNIILFSLWLFCDGIIWISKSRYFGNLRSKIRMYLLSEVQSPLFQVMLTEIIQELKEF